MPVLVGAMRRARWTSSASAPQQPDGAHERELREQLAPSDNPDPSARADVSVPARATPLVDFRHGFTPKPQEEIVQRRVRVACLVLCDTNVAEHGRTSCGNAGELQERHAPDPAIAKREDHVVPASGKLLDIHAGVRGEPEVRPHAHAHPPEQVGAAPARDVSKALVVFCQADAPAAIVRRRLRKDCDARREQTFGELWVLHELLAHPYVDELLAHIAPQGIIVGLDSGTELLRPARGGRLEYGVR